MYNYKLAGEIMQELGLKIKLLRKSYNLSQANLADKVGVNRRLIGEIESGNGTSMLIFIKILKVFNKTEKLLEILESNPISPKEMFKKQNK
jgi:transcriptional regulator with XRE-family HTH domain